jgi:hypothetical protein
MEAREECPETCMIERSVANGTAARMCPVKGGSSFKVITPPLVHSHSVTSQRAIPKETMAEFLALPKSPLCRQSR